MDKIVNQEGLIPMMAKLSKEFRALVMEKFQKNGIQLNKEQAIILKILTDVNECPQNDLALVTSRDKTTLTRLLTTMEKKSLIQRRQCKSDKRVNLVSITDTGLIAFKEAEPILTTILDDAVTGIEEHRINEAKLLIKDIYNNLNIPYEK
ncbi:MarR family winged helix-turn-helix transcriptional regulator [Membranihabitans marinus]|uniref:MarR family winged helix-turn-helix transcriptional regulator n=1 Tax=Membranihabitans marinus TaxID=1227546 RepID=UPI001F24116E|nr:MarR family winged helix-turn-helix transcriptional regulator [Membranihabitans marinus]